MTRGPSLMEGKRGRDKIAWLWFNVPDLLATGKNKIHIGR